MPKAKKALFPRIFASRSLMLFTDVEKYTKRKALGAKCLGL
jgi:hypothetical protein